MQWVLREIQNGRFAKGWLPENVASRRRNTRYENGDNHFIEGVGKRRP